MAFEWDDDKNRLNIEQHGISFEDAALVFDGPVTTLFSPRFGEDRWVATGQVDQLVITVVYTERGDHRRLISARRARRKERDEYEKAHRHGLGPPPPHERG